MPVAVLVLGLLVTLASTLILRANAQARDYARFMNAVQSASDRIQRRLDAYLALLQATGGMFESQHEVTPEEFSEYVGRLDLHQNYPGIQGIGFTLRFHPEQRDAIEAWARREGNLPDFRAWPQATGDQQHAIVMLEPRDERNLAAMGYDMFSEPIRREAMSLARDTGQPALSGKVTLKQEIDEKKQAGFLLYMPVYRGAPAQSVEERRARLHGFVYSPFRAEDLLTGIFGTELPRAAFQLYDGPTIDPSKLLFRSHGPEEPVRSRFEKTVTLTVAGRPWTLAFASLPALDHTSSEEQVVPFALTGVLISLALFLMTRAQIRARAEAERSADDLRLALAERARIAEQLRDADRRKDDFLAMLAHELRNPLAPVLTAVQLMNRKLASKHEVAHEREVIERQVHHMGRLVDDLLDVSRVTRGKIQLQKAPLDLVAAVARAVETARPFATERQQALLAQLPEGPLWAEADPVRFEQVLINLLHNAAKYSEPGGRITVTLAREGVEAAVRIADTGVGIAPEALPLLFEPFVQIGRTLDRAQGGLGLGLTLVKQLVELHGGSVSATSEGAGKGSVFTVRIPLLPADQVPQAVPAAAQPAQRVSGRSRRVLVVDDNLDAAQLLGEVLELEGHQVSVVHDGRAALEQVKSFAPEVIFLDIGLPGMDGYEVAREIRRRPECAGMRLVAVTGYGQASDRRRSQEAGFDGHLVKPVEVDAVREQAEQSGGGGLEVAAPG